MITHANLMAETDNIIARYDRVFSAKAGEQGSLLLFLPLAHVFGRMVEVAAVRAGLKVGHQPEMTARALLPDLAAFRPTFIQAVPHLFEKIFASARRKAESEGRLGPFEKAVEVAVRYAEAVEHKAFGTGPGPGASLRMQHQFYDKFVYTKLREAMGGRCRYAMSGGSAMERRLGLFFDGAGMRIFEGYGLTETTAAAVANPPERPRFGTVGQPVPGTTVRIAEDGEILVSGGQIFGGYLNNARATQGTLRGGWFATGDLGVLDEDGYLTITGRKKEILVTSSGKSVSPGPLEDRVREHPLVGQCSASCWGTTGRTSPRSSRSTRRRCSTGSRCARSPRRTPRTCCGTRTWRRRCAGRWSPRTPRCPRRSRSARSASSRRPSPRRTDC